MIKFLIISRATEVLKTNKIKFISYNANTKWKEEHKVESYK